MKITIKDVEYVAKLARLFVTDEEKIKFTEQLGTILEYMDELNKLNTENILPTSHAVVMKNVFREDEVKKSDTADDIIANACQKDGRYFRVKKVI